MHLGEKLRQARLEAGLSQRQLCGEEITRNMLSQIENGAASPSLATLRYLAGRLEKPLSFFLEETPTVSANHSVIFAARELFERGDWAGTAAALDDYRPPDEIFDREAALLDCLARLHWAESLQKSGRERYARELLEQLSTRGLYCADDLERRRLLLLGRAEELPSLDEELLLRAEAALEGGSGHRAGSLLDAAQDPSSPRWQLLRGRACLAEKAYAAAIPHLQQAEEAFPAQALPCLEECWRELGDFQQAYACACRRMSLLR